MTDEQKKEVREQEYRADEVNKEREKKEKEYEMELDYHRKGVKHEN